LHLLGVPTGRDEVKAYGELAVTRGDRELGRYRGEATASRIYGLYYGASMLALEDEARTAVKRVVDQALASDVPTLGARPNAAPHD
jgi:hypothetical protein